MISSLTQHSRRSSCSSFPHADRIATSTTAKTTTRTGRGHRNRRSDARTPSRKSVADLQERLGRYGVDVLCGQEGEQEYRRIKIERESRIWERTEALFYISWIIVAGIEMQCEETQMAGPPTHRPRHAHIFRKQGCIIWKEISPGGYFREPKDSNPCQQSGFTARISGLPIPVHERDLCYTVSLNSNRA